MEMTATADLAFSRLLRGHSANFIRKRSDYARGSKYDLDHAEQQWGITKLTSVGLKGI